MQREAVDDDEAWEEEDDDMEEDEEGEEGEGEDGEEGEDDEEADEEDEEEDKEDGEEASERQEDDTVSGLPDVSIEADVNERRKRRAEQLAAADPPAPDNFDGLGLDLRLLKALRKLGLERPTKVQARCIPLALQGKDVLARAPTGSGKTYAYAIPMLQKVLARHDACETVSKGVGAVVLVPTRELCQQVHGVVRKLLGHAGAAGVRIVQVAAASDAAGLSADAPPDAIIATPVQLRKLLEQPDAGGRAARGVGSVRLRDSLQTLIVDEADLLLSYGYGDDINAIGAALPRSVQTMLISATITPDVQSITALFLHNPATVDVADEASGGGLRQFYLKCSHHDKFLLMYALFKLNRIPGRSLIFVNSVDRGFRLKLFLGQFGVSTGVLNCELPLASRWHSIQAFNRGLFDILIVTDDPKLMVGRAGEGGAADAAGAAAAEEGATADAKKGRKRPKQTASAADAEFGVSRGVDFADVTAVVNMDLPESLPVYKHRVGRTARGGQGGTAISMVSPEGPDNALLEEMLSSYGDGLHQFAVDMTKLAAFQYRTDDALRAVTRRAVKDARLAEIKRELLHSRKLSEHFDANPDDLNLLRHDQPTPSARKQAHLAHVPSYLKPDMQGATTTVAAVATRRNVGMADAKRRKLYGKKKSKDPLKNARGRGKGGRGGRGGR